MITALFAVDQTGGMGLNGSMPWPSNKDDMRWFKDLTTGQVVVMGKRSWESPDMPHPLPKRQNVVFTNDFFEQPEIDQVRGDVLEFLNAAPLLYENKEIFIIGGANLLMQSKPAIDRIFLTRIHGEYPCDVKIDVEEFLSGFELVNTIDLGSCKVEEYAPI